MTRNGTVGILGGMGPEATLELFRQIIALTPARKDQEHLHIVIDSNPLIPDRTAAILEEGESPLPMMIKGARVLEQAGADFLVIPCNTAHHWLSHLRKAVSIPIIDMISETATTIASYNPLIKTVGLLATMGTVKCGLYQRALGDHDVSLLVSADQEQVRIMDAITHIKAGDHSVKDTVIAVAQHLIDQGASGIIPGCTELSLVVEEAGLSCPLFDPLSILARRAVEWAREKSARL